jgi:uncharacterized membrane protein
MKRKPDEKKKVDTYTRLLRRNWIIFFVVLVISLFLYYGLPLITDTASAAVCAAGLPNRI